MSGRKGVADTSRGPLMRPGEDDPGLGIQLMRQLREQKWSYQRIADTIYPDVPRGAAYRRVYKALNREQVRRWDSASEKRNRARITQRDLQRRRETADRCETCGDLLCRPGAKSPCAKCRKKKREENLRWIVQAWNAGVPTSQIAAATGMSANGVSAEIAEARRRGMEVAWRRPGGRRLPLGDQLREIAGEERIGGR